MITVEGINKTFGDNHVLHDITTTFEKGKVNLIIGQSGQGKSVLTKCVVGLHDPDTGSVIYNGRNFTEMDRKEKVSVRKEIGMLFQGSALFDSMTVEDNVMFPLTMFTNMTKKEKLDRVNFCLDRVNLNETNALFPAECSGGMQKRVALARAIVDEPEILLFDEPTSGLDPITCGVIDRLIIDARKRLGATTVTISHDMASVRRIADKVAMVHNGVIIWCGPAEEMDDTGIPEVHQFVHGLADGPLTLAAQAEARGH